MLELKFSIYHRAASISSYAVLAEESLTAQWKMLLFCAKTIVKESHKFELARLKKKKKKKEKHFGRLVTFWFGTFAMLFSATGCVVHHENTRR